MDNSLKRTLLSTLLVVAFTFCFNLETHAQAMVTKGQEVQLIWFGGVTTLSYQNIQVETANGNLKFTVKFQLPDGSPGVNKKGYTLPLYWISEFGTFLGKGTVTPNGQVIARFLVKTRSGK